MGRERSAVSPLVLAGLGVLGFSRERPSLHSWLGSAAGLGAVTAFAVHEGGGSLHRADLLLVAAVGVAALAYLEGAVLTQAMPGWTVISWALVLSAPVTVELAVASLVASGAPDATAGQWSAFLYAVDLDPA